MDERPWYSGLFDDDYLRVFGPVLPEERTAAEVSGVVGQLGVAPGARLLDMRRLPFADASFDAVLNLFHAFGYLEDETQDELVLAEVARVLAPGGRFLLEVANREALVRAGTTATSPAMTTAWSCSRNGPLTCVPAGTWSATPCCTQLNSVNHPFVAMG